MNQSTKRHLRLVPTGQAAMGPFERMGLRDRFYVSPGKLTFLIVTKLILLGSLIYLVYG